MHETRTLFDRKGLAIKFERYNFEDTTMLGVSWTSTTLWNLRPGWVLCIGFVFAAITVYRTYTRVEASPHSQEGPTS